MPSNTASGSCSTDGYMTYASGEVKFCVSGAWKYPFCNSVPVTNGACSTAGMITWNGTSGYHEFCNGTNWIQMVDCGGGGGGGGTGNGFCWGSDSQGQIGNGATTGNQASPVAVTLPSGVSSWTAISNSGSGSSNDAACAIADTGNAYCWGVDGSGQLGNGATTGNQEDPSQVTLPSGVTSWSAISVGNAFACGIANTGNAYCWGSDSAGQLGNGATTGNQTSPSLVTNPSGVTSWFAISAGYTHACGIGNNGYAYCWGADTFGELGNDTGVTSDQTSPYLVNNPSGVTSWTVIAAGSYQTCGIGNNNQAYCWGDDTYGQLGNGAGVTGNQAAPYLVTNPSGVTGWTKISSGYALTCGVGDNNNAYCWGQDGSGQLGNGATTGTQHSPSLVVNPSGVTSWTAISAGNQASCGIGNNGNAYCWGADTNGVLGNGSSPSSSQTSPYLVTNPSGVTSWGAISTVRTGSNPSSCGIGN